MGIFDRWFKKSEKTKSGLQSYLDTNTNALLKEARTPVYDAAAAASYQYGNQLIEPPFDQHYVEYLADKYSHLRTVIQKIAAQVVAKGWAIEQLTEDNPSEDQKTGLENIITNPSNGCADINGSEIIKALVRQLEIFDDAWVSIIYERVISESGEVIGKKVKELWVEDTKKMRYNTDRYGRFQDVDRFCPVCRTGSGEAKHCENSQCNDTQTALIAYTFQDEEGDIYFARDEIIHFNKYSSYARLYGNPPILALTKKIETGLAVENYQNKVYMLERPPKGFLDIPGHNEDSLTRLGSYIAEETARNPNFIPIISSGEGKSGANFVTVMPDTTEMGMMPYLEKINNDINAAYGVMPLAMGDTAGIGGLNSEGEQITMMDRTIMETQAVLEEGFFRPLLKLMNITDWEVKFTPINEDNEQMELSNLTQKLEIIRGFQELGITIDMDENADLILPDDGIKEELEREQNESRAEEEQNELMDTSENSKPQFAKP
tara:strand:+ start:3033 stop:4502 length:1470 start_codon:yes stop_codon:yes gene_type:complete